jgi:hypothetical protein
MLTRGALRSRDQAGTRNFRVGAGAANWWNGEQFAQSAFWLHA